MTVSGLYMVILKNNSFDYVINILGQKDLAIKLFINNDHYKPF